MDRTGRHKIVGEDMMGMGLRYLGRCVSGI